MHSKLTKRPPQTMLMSRFWQAHSYGVPVHSSTTSIMGIAILLAGGARHLMHAHKLASLSNGSRYDYFVWVHFRCCDDDVNKYQYMAPVALCNVQCVGSRNTEWVLPHHYHLLLSSRLASKTDQNQCRNGILWGAHQNLANPRMVAHWPSQPKSSRSTRWLISIAPAVYQNPRRCDHTQGNSK